MTLKMLWSTGTKMASFEGHTRSIIRALTTRPSTMWVYAVGCYSVQRPLHLFYLHHDVRQYGRVLLVGRVRAHLSVRRRVRAESGNTPPLFHTERNKSSSTLGGIAR